jgi:hypothetical protein
MDSVSLQPFSFEEWNAHCTLSTNIARRSSVKVVVAQAGAAGKPCLLDQLEHKSVTEILHSLRLEQG